MVGASERSAYGLHLLLLAHLGLVLLLGELLQLVLG